MKRVFYIDEAILFQKFLKIHVDVHKLFSYHALVC